MGVMLYSHGNGTRVWGKEYKTIIVRDDEVAEYLKQGWHKHPDEVKAEQEPVKRTRKNKAESDESDD